jgi:hypothetical protein
MDTLSCTITRGSHFMNGISIHEIGEREAHSALHFQRNTINIENKSTKALFLSHKMPLNQIINIK